MSLVLCAKPLVFFDDLSPQKVMSLLPFIFPNTAFTFELILIMFSNDCDVGAFEKIYLWHNLN